MNKTELRTWFGTDQYGDIKAHIAAQDNDPRYLETLYLVEATDFEAHAQWCFFSKDIYLYTSDIHRQVQT